MAGPVGIGVIGAGTISDTYLENLTSFADTDVLAIGDLFPEAAQLKAAKYDIAAAGDVATVLDHPGVEIVVNLTIPAAHAEVAGQAIAAGRHVWNEKPLALDRFSGQRLLDDAAAAGLRVGCAPDTFLGSGLQTACRLIEQGMIGTPLTALALLQLPGPEAWHPNPAFLYAAGAGPLFDLGPYYLTALVQVFGPAASVAALGSKARERRVIGSGPKAGEEFDVTVPSHVSALAQFESGQSRRPFSPSTQRFLVLCWRSTAPTRRCFSRSQLLRRPDRHQTAGRRGLGDGGHHDGEVLPWHGSAGDGSRSSRGQTASCAGSAGLSRS